MTVKFLFMIFNFLLRWTFQLSNFPTFQLSNFPTFQLSNFPTFQLSNFPIFQFSNFPIFQFSNFSIFQFFNFSIFQLNRHPDHRVGSIFQTQKINLNAAFFQHENSLNSSSWLSLLLFLILLKCKK